MTTGKLTINIWQARRVVEVLEAIDQGRDPGDDSLNTAYAEIELKLVDGERILTLKSEAGPYAAIWHDGTDVTDEYPETNDDT